MASTSGPATPATLHSLRFIPARVPALLLRCFVNTRLGASGDRTPFDASEHWFRCRFAAEPAEPDEEIVLTFGGIATIAEVWLNGEPILNSNSMFASHEAEVSALLRGRNELLIVCRSLTAAMREQRRQPPVGTLAVRVSSANSLCAGFRTTLFGRATVSLRSPNRWGRGAQ